MDEFTAKLLQFLRDARCWLDDKRLYRNEFDTRKRNETNQGHADRISDWMQENEDLRTLKEEIDALLAEAPAATGAQAEALERLRLAFIVNGLRQFPEKSRDDIAAEADRIIGG